jgi:methyl-accepting chemotaxis protein
LDSVVQTVIAHGDMSQLEGVLAKYSELDGVLEYSVYSHEGIASYSTRREIVKSKAELPPDLKDKRLKDPTQVARRTETAFETFTPMVTTAKRLECHDDLKSGQVGGVTVLRLSTAPQEKSRTNWMAASAGIQKTNAKIAAATTLCIAVVFALLIWWTVRSLVTRPLDAVIGRLRASASQLNAASSEFSANSQTLAQGASEQAASLEEIPSMTARNAQNAEAANDLAQQTRQAADDSVRDMQMLSAASEAIRTSSQNVAKIFKTIEEIACQTNLLALNASIEAARRGKRAGIFCRR